MTDDDLDGARVRTHSQKHLAQANGEVIDILVKLAHANGWNIKESLVAARTLIDQATDDLEVRQAYKDRLAVLLDGLN